MDKGAARSRKRDEKAKRDAERAAAEASTQRLTKLLDDGPKSGKKGMGKGKGKGKNREDKDETKAETEKHPDREIDPNQYKPKAIRSARALIYSAEAFDVPPPPERLEGVTRVDLEGSGCTDVSWLRGTAVTWLSVKGCQVSAGWDAVASLEGLSVLNISGCGLVRLPAELAALSNLKAIVAMNNDWTELDGGVVAGWGDLNSMIVSHSPKLTSLPATLSTLPHLAKLTISHCPRLTAASLPDLSSLPLLRDVRANNLPRLASFPSHLGTWGTGNLALAGKGKPGDAERNGDGLEVLDVGNCSIPFSAIVAAFSLGSAVKPKRTWNLRSITLQANPLAIEEPKYAELLQSSPALPRLQIIDSKRVVERKRAGALPETKAERRGREQKEGKMRPTGANTGGSKMRVWGTGEKDEGGEGGEERKRKRDAPAPRKTEKEKAEKAEKAERAEKVERVEKKAKVARTEPKTGERTDKTPSTRSEKAPKRKERFFEATPAEEAKSTTTTTKTKTTPKPSAVPESEAADRPAKKRKRKHTSSSVPAPAAATTPTAAKDKAEHPKLVAVKDAKPKKKKSETAVLGVVEVKPKSGGVDLKSVVREDSGTGLGVGGW